MTIILYDTPSLSLQAVQNVSDSLSFFNIVSVLMPAFWVYHSFALHEADESVDMFSTVSSRTSLVCYCVHEIPAGRGFNIDSLVVCCTVLRVLSRIYIDRRASPRVIAHERRLLEDLVRLPTLPHPRKSCVLPRRY